MIADRGDFAKALKDSHERKRAEMLPAAHLLASAKPVMEALLLDDRWTRYQQTLQGLIERWKAQRDTAKNRLGVVELTDSELRKLNTDVLSANATINALELAIGLPAALAKGGEEAVAMIKEFEKQNETTADSKP